MLYEEFRGHSTVSKYVCLSVKLELEVSNCQEGGGVSIVFQSGFIFDVVVFRDVISSV